MSLLRLQLLNNKYPALHGLRCLAILDIIQLHAMELTTSITMDIPHGISTLQTLETVSLNAWFAMDLFFLLSGFLIGRMLFAARHQDGRLQWWRFYARRSLRILPLYYIFLLTAYFLNPVFPMTTSLNEGTFTSLHYNELLYLTNYPFRPENYLVYWSWSLSAEEHFYLACPLIVLFIQSRRSTAAKLWIFSLAMLTPLLARTVTFLKYFSLDPIRPMAYLYMPTHTHFDPFVAGLFVAFLDFHYSSRLQTIMARRSIQYACVALSLVIFALFLSPQINPNPSGRFFTTHASDLEWVWKTGIFYYGTLTSLAYFTLLLWALYAKNAVTRLLSRPMFLRLSTLGYGVYLVHMIVCSHMAHRLQSWFANPSGHLAACWILNVTLTTLISLMLAYAMHILIEKPFLYLRDRVAP